MMRLSILSAALGFVLTGSSAWAQTKESPQKVETKPATKTTTETKEFRLTDEDLAGRILQYEQDIAAAKKIIAHADPSDPASARELNEARVALTYKTQALESLKARSRALTNTLENQLAQALKNNPDIRVAEAKVREAEAELNRVRLQVSQKITVLNAEIARTRKTYEEATIKAQTAERQFQTKSIALEDYRSAVLKRDKLQLDLTCLEAELPYLLGNSAMLVGEKSADGRFWRVGTSDGTITAVPFSIWAAGPDGSPKAVDKKNQPKPAGGAPYSGSRAAPEPNPQYLIERLNSNHLEGTNFNNDLFMALNNYAALQNKPPIPSDTADKIRKALDSPITVNFNQVSPKDVLTYLKERAKGFNLVEQVNMEKAAPVNLHLTEPVPVAALPVPRRSIWLALCGARIRHRCRR